MIKKILTAAFVSAIFGTIVSAQTKLGNALGQQTGNETAVSKAEVETPVIKHKVVIELTSSDTSVWKAVINNVRHMEEGWGNNFIAEVVVHGPGIGFLISGKTTQQANIAKYKKMGVKFYACENTIRERKIPKSTIIPEADFVPMGVGEIIMKQEEGWSYLKVGF